MSKQILSLFSLLLLALVQVAAQSGQFTLPAGTSDQYAYGYTYDDRGNQIEKKLPGAGVIYMVFDRLDRQVLAQDANQRLTNQWSFTKYDEFDNPILVGEITIAGTREEIQQQVDEHGPLFERYEEGGLFHYTNVTFPLIGDSCQVHTAIYLDHYGASSAWGAAYDFKPRQELDVTSYSMEITGKVTASITRVLNTPCDSLVWLKSVSYFDDYLRPIEDISNNTLGGYSLSVTQYEDDISNLVLQTYSSQNTPVSWIAQTNEFEYDLGGRLVRTYSTNHVPEWEHLAGMIRDEAGIQKYEPGYLKKDPNVSGWGNIGAHSAQVLEGDGWIEIMVSENQFSVIGLTPADEANDDADTSVKYGFYFKPDYSTRETTVRVMELGGAVFSLPIAKPGDYYRIERLGNSIHYMLNGEVLYTSLLQDNNEPLKIDIAGYANSITNQQSEMHISCSFGDRILIAENNFDEFGEIIEVNTHSEDNGLTFAQSTDFTFGVRGELLAINGSVSEADGDYWGAEYFYENPHPLSSLASTQTPKFDDNISLITTTGPLSGHQQHATAYTYDKRNQLLTADYSTFLNSQWDTTTDLFDVTNLSYDKHGNILSLKRMGKHEMNPITMDDLTYTYQGNQLLAVEDDNGTDQGFKNGATANEEYQYDLNGSMIKDLNKGIDKVTYNSLDLPYKVVMETAGDSVKYFYTAEGTKVRQEVYDDGELKKVTDYMGSVIIENDTVALVNTVDGRMLWKREREIPGWEYQYHLTDHLDNTRLTYTTAQESYEYLATMESENAEIEELWFQNMDTRHLYENANSTPGGDKSAALNNANPMGPLFAVNVLPGDTVHMEVAAYYEDGIESSSKLPSETLIASLTGALGGGGSLAGNESPLIDAFSNSVAEGGSFAMMNNANNNDVPAAYLAFKLYDEQMDELLQEDYIPISASANMSHELLSINNLMISEKGTLVIFVANESNSSNPVYFDDLKITHSHGPLVQSDDYYPFGLTYNSVKKASQKKNKYLYIGKEQQDAHGLDWYDHGARMLAADLGRWHVVDPLSELFYSWSPYNSVMNDGINLLDKNGMNPLRAWAGAAASAGEKASEAPNEMSEATKDMIIAGGKAIYSLGEEYVVNKATDWYNTITFKDPLATLKREVSEGKEYAEGLGEDAAKTYIAIYEKQDPIAITQATVATGAGIWGGTRAIKESNRKLNELKKRAGVAKTAKKKPKSKKKKKKPCGCFTAGTKVIVGYASDSTYLYKNIEDIELGDKVLSYNEQTGENEMREVIALIPNEAYEIYQITIGDVVIEATYEHPFYVVGRVGEELVTLEKATDLLGVMNWCKWFLEDADHKAMIRMKEQLIAEKMKEVELIKLLKEKAEYLFKQYKQPISEDELGDQE